MALPGRRRTALLVLGSLLLLRLSQMSVYNATVLLLGNSCGWAWQTVRSAPAPTPPLKAAILNVTSDFDQLAFLVGDFLQQPGMDPQVEQRFKQYLMDRASRSYPRFESLLDWLLAVYKFVFPFLIISLAAKRGSGSRDPGAEPGGVESDAAEAAAGEPAGEDGDLMSLRGSGLQLPPHSILARQSSLQANGSLPRDAASSDAGGSGAANALARQQQLAVRSSFGGAFKAARSTSGGFVGRGGSQSPRGPETPVDGGFLRQLPEHPLARRASVKAHRQRLPVPDELVGPARF
ncbi:hypothetical protein ACK3TF_005543 [Chlorella vulgaris]